MQHFLSTRWKNWQTCNTIIYDFLLSSGLTHNTFSLTEVGDFSPWGEWSQCDKSCGLGHRERTRECNNPEPKCGGPTCAGRNFEIEPCNDTPCPSKFVNSFFMTWIPWNLSFHYISFHEKKTANDAVTPQRQSQFTPKMKANAIPRLLSSLVWIDQYSECNGMTSFMNFM